MGFFTVAVSIIGSAAVSTFSNSRARKTSNMANAAGNRQAYQNALGNQQLAITNSGILGSIGGLNAEQILEVASMNYDFIISARDRNAELMGVERVENMRRHLNDEVDSAGLIRVGYAAGGISTNSGSALGVKISEMRKAEVDRDYMDMVSEKTINNFWLTETQRANMVLREGALGAEAALFNAEAEGAMLRAEAQTAVDNARRNAGIGVNISNGGANVRIGQGRR